ncbi:MAG: hypothetical protein H5T86_01085, partial [Armatimonadetes bacterium]|nr:hypothetical protein [Armatimonadota bacterium]
MAGSGAAGSRTYTYVIPSFLQGRVAPGTYVLVPFGPLHRPGYVISLTDTAPPVKLKAIARLLADEPLVGEQQMAMARWIAEQWLAPVSDAIRLFLPPGGTSAVTEYVSLVAAPDEASLARAPRQRAVVEALAAADGEITTAGLLRHLRAKAWPQCTLAALGSVLRSLRAKGFVELRRTLRAPTGHPLIRRVVELADPERAQAALPELSA